MFLFPLACNEERRRSCGSHCRLRSLFSLMFVLPLSTASPLLGSEERKKENADPLLLLNRFPTYNEQVASSEGAQKIKQKGASSPELATLDTMIHVRITCVYIRVHTRASETAS